MNYVITKLDKRHSWHSAFEYMIEFRRSRTSYLNRSNAGVLEFDQARKWFNEKFGWSQDVETRAEITRAVHGVPGVVNDQDAYNNHWAYSIKYNDYRIYVCNEATLNWFVLSYPSTHE